jgi:hypothetical protein
MLKDTPAKINGLKESATCPTGMDKRGPTGNAKRFLDSQRKCTILYNK